MLASFTSTNSDSPSERLAQGRERRRAARPRLESLSDQAMAARTTMSSPDSPEDEIWHDAALGPPLLRLNHDAASQQSGSVKYQTESGSPYSTRSAALPVAEPIKEDVAESPSALPASPPAPSPKRSSSPVVIAEIPPFRGGSRSPASSAAPSPVSSPVLDGSAATAPVKLVDGGVLARLKAARMAKIPSGAAGTTATATAPASPAPDVEIPRPPSPTHSLPFDIPPSTRPSDPATSAAPPQVHESHRASSFAEGPITASPPTMSPESLDSRPIQSSPTKVVTNRLKEQILADMRARNAAKATERSAQASIASPSNRLVSPPLAPIPLPDSPSALPPRPASLRSTSTAASKKTSPHKNAPTHPPSPTIDQFSPGADAVPLPRPVEVIHESTPESRAAEIEAWFAGQSGSRIVGVEGWDHHSLSEIEERTEKSTLSTRHASSSLSRSGHARNASQNSLPSIVERPQRVARPLSVASHSSTGRQLADGSYQGAGSAIPPSPSKRKPAPPLVETAARLLEGYQGSDAQKSFDKGTEQLRHYVESQQREPAGIRPSIGADTRHDRHAGSEGDRSASPTRRPLSPELAKKAAAFMVDSSARQHDVFGGGGDDASLGSDAERRQRELERERRKKEREARWGGNAPSAESKPDARPQIVTNKSTGSTVPPYQSQPPSVEASSRRRARSTIEQASRSATEQSSEGLSLPPVLWEGKLFIPPPSTSTSTALLNPGDWQQQYAVLTRDTLEFRPTDVTGPFTPIVVLCPSEICRIEGDLKADGIRAFRITTADGKKHLFGCFRPSDKANWVDAFEDVASLSRTAHRSSTSTIADRSALQTPIQSPSKRRYVGESSARRRVEEFEGPTSILSATESLRRGRSGKSFRSTSQGEGREDQSMPPRTPPTTFEGPLSKSPEHRDLFGRLRERPVLSGPAANSDVGVEPTYQPRSLPSSPSKSPYRQSVRSVLPTVPSPYTQHQRSRSDLPRSTSASPYNAEEDSPFRPKPVRPAPHSTRRAASGDNTSGSRPSQRSLASVLPPQSAKELRDALHDVMQTTLGLEQDSESQQLALLRLKDMLAVMIAAIDAEADLGEPEYVLLRWQMRDRLFNTYEALKAADRHATVRQQAEDAAFLDMNRPSRSLNSSNSKYEAEDLARIDVLTRQLLQDLDEEVGDGGDPRYQPFRDGIWTQKAPQQRSRPLFNQEHYEQEPSEPSERGPLPRPPVKSPEHRSPPATHPLFYDGASKTTRGGAYSASEHASWEDDRRRFDDEARLAAQISESLESSVASPNRTRRARSTAADLLEGRAAKFPSPTPTDLETFSRGMPSVVRANEQAASSTPLYPQAQQSRSIEEISKWSSTTSTDDVEERPRHRKAVSEYSTGTARPNRSAMTAEILQALQQQFQVTGEHISHANHQREQMGVFVNELAQVMNETRHTNHDQFERLIGSIENLRTHLGNLPEQLAQRLREEMGQGHLPALDLHQDYLRPSSAPPFAHIEQQQPVVDDDDGSTATLVDQLEAQADAAETSNRVRFGINPLSSFAKLDKKMAESGDVLDKDGKLVRKGSTGAKKPRGPRMPAIAGLKMWGGPAPVSMEEHAQRWGGGARSLSRAASNAALSKALKDDADASKPKHGPIVEAIQTDEGLAHALQNLAEGTGEKEIDAETMALAVFEILQSMREISRKQKEAEEREKEEKARNGGLSRKERAELEAKKEEIRRLEQIAQMGDSREAKLDSAILALAEKSTQQDALLQQIAAGMEASKGPTHFDIEPLTKETKKLLGQVKAGVDDHVKDFRGQLTSEVQRMFKEVGKLRDEKKALQTDIAELMSFQAKHGGSSSAGSVKDVGPKLASPSSPLKPGMPTVGFFGPRAMK